jgi:hypothetical protein
MYDHSARCKLDVIFDVFTAVKIELMVFWDVVPWYPVTTLHGATAQNTMNSKI